MHGLCQIFPREQELAGLMLKVNGPKTRRLRGGQLVNQVWQIDLADQKVNGWVLVRFY